ncbi:hypothetical protein [Shewanella algae]|uniref:hypothetical protein n=1 Tax=Shewanella algae TaxID=38313 RepID=UPI001AAF4BF4|nr:hypothetical protein [Shewanella algae]MBO2589351.1 hypothetical protein [Shewanella algae]
MSKANNNDNTAISKAMWQALEAELASSLVNVAFRYKGYELSIFRERKNESTTCLSVYIDGLIKGAWCVSINSLPSDAPDILSEVWPTKSIARYTPREIKNIEKVWGKREAKKLFPDLHTRIEYLAPYFSKASVLCRQFKKLEGLELTKAACMQCSNPTG